MARFLIKQAFKLVESDRWVRDPWPWCMVSWHGTVRPRRTGTEVGDGTAARWPDSHDAIVNWLTLAPERGDYSATQRMRRETTDYIAEAVHDERLRLSNAVAYPEIMDRGQARAPSLPFPSYPSSPIPSPPLPSPPLTFPLLFFPPLPSPSHPSRSLEVGPLKSS